MPKEERQIKEIKDNDLDTGRDLVTENYELEILTLKDKVDLRRFSKSFLKVDKLLKSIFTGKEDKFPKNNGFNRVKTDLVENDTNKVFTAKGAFDLKTYLITNYTTLMNNIRDTLTNLINTKLSHGGYGGNGQQLKNEIDTKVFKNSININTSVDFNNFETSGFYNVYKASGVIFTNAPNSNFDYGTLLVIGQGKAVTSFVTQIATRRDTGLTYIRTRNDGSMAWTNWVSMYGTNNKPSKADVGLGNVSNFPITSAINEPSHSFYATAGAVKQANDNANGRVSKSGDTMTGTLTVPSLIDNSSNFGKRTTAYTTIPAGGWNLPVGSSRFLHPNSVGGPGASGYLLTIGARDVSEGKGFILGGYSAGHNYFGRLDLGSGTPSWDRLYSTSFKPTAAEIGALPNPGYGGTHELGRYLDLHLSGSVADYDARIWTDGGNRICTSGVFAASGRVIVDASRFGTGVGQEPAISLAIGDSDTGFNWVSDGNVYAQANGKQLWNITGVVYGIRLGTIISRQIWNSSQSSTEDKGYVTVAVRNTNADELVDSELRRPLQVLVNGSWVTVSTI